MRYLGAQLDYERARADAFRCLRIPIIFKRRSLDRTRLISRVVLDIAFLIATRRLDDICLPLRS